MIVLNWRVGWAWEADLLIDERASKVTKKTFEAAIDPYGSPIGNGW